MKRTQTGMSVLIIATAICVACGVNEPRVDRGGGYVKGVVSDSETSMPVDSVLLHLEINASDTSSALEHTLSDSTGSYMLFSGFHAGKLYVSATKEQYLRATREVCIIRGDTIVCDIELEKE